MSDGRAGRPTKYRPDVGETLVRLVERGLTFEAAAREVGVHPATLYRWQNKHPDLEGALRDAAHRREGFWRAIRRERRHPRPGVPWRKDCPECGYDLEVKTASGAGWFRFYRCGRWPRCRFASWRPPTPWTCPLCGEVTFWSHSRKSVSCETYWCRYRQYTQPS